MEGYKMGVCSNQKGSSEVLTREPQVSSELNNLDKRISELSAILAILEKKLTPILPNVGQETSDNKQLQSAGSTLVPLAFSISQQTSDVQRIINRVDYLNNSIEV
jgi:predicted RNase H-like nuclease (RuvC/YqgF family)